ncbi:MAG: MBL fold metallo-hydrolase [Planctomycetota bacterium]|nr:MBL fold metallo-hydrolase [Planctomycetota bacterium]
MTTWSCTLLRAGSFRLDGGSMFGVVPRAIWSNLVTPDADNCIPLQTNCLLLELDGSRVLVETGNGGKWSAKERAIFGIEDRTVETALGEVGISPEQIDLIIVTHLHFDHAGGLTRMTPSGELVPTFPNAEVVVQQREWDDALANRSTMNATYLRSHLDPIADCVRCVEGEVLITDGLRVLPTPGHTWGHQSVLVEETDGLICFTGDLLPTRNHSGRAWSMGYDMLPHDTLLTKETLLARAADEGWRLVLDHEPGEPMVAVDRDDSKAWFQLVPTRVPLR